jgi:hypothetical protein
VSNVLILIQTLAAQTLYSLQGCQLVHELGLLALPVVMMLSPCRLT